MQPKIYTIDEHLIPIEKIDPKAFYVLHKLRQHNHIAYLVGGGVRDLLLNLRPKDFDISTSAKPHEIKKLFRNCILIGKRFRLAHIRFGKKVIEVATFRSGDTEGKELIIEDNIWGTEEEDVLRRDFTINGLFYDPETQTVIDYVGGFQDLQKKMIRSIGDPLIRFHQDPVRMIRLLKFRARFGFDIDENTYQALQDCRQEITKSSQARIFEELLQMLELGSSKNFFSLLFIHKILHELLPLISYHLQDKEKAKNLLALLDKVDEIHKNTFPKTLFRSILLCCLVFPLFDKYIKEEFLLSHPSYHLGMITNEAHVMIQEIFQPFFHIPRRIKAEMVSILTNQYRIQPLIKKKRTKRHRIPKDPFFALGLKFFKIRSLIDEKLFPLYQEWEISFLKRKKPKEHS